MLFRPIQADGGVPIYEQIAAQIIYAIAAGDLLSGAELKSVRDVAPELMVHPNTVVRAYQDLERAGIILSRRGRNMIVTPEGPALCRAKRHAILRDRIRHALREARSALPLDEVRQLVEAELGQLANISAEESIHVRDH